MESSGRAHSVPRPALRRRYADAPAGAPRCAPSAPAKAHRRVPPASQSGLLAAFIYPIARWRLDTFGDQPSRNERAARQPERLQAIQPRAELGASTIYLAL